MKKDSAANQLQCDLCASQAFQNRYQFEDISVIECRTCGLVFVQTKEGINDLNLKKIYSSNYFLERNEYFDQGKKENLKGVKQEHHQDFRNGLDLIKKYKNSGRLLDIGCATGTFLNLARSQGWQACGIDISEFAVSQVQSHYNIEAYVGTLSEINFPDASFDVITLWDVLEHFTSPSEELKEIHRVLKDDGIILFNTPNEKALIRKVAQYLYQFSGSRISAPARKLHHIFHLYYFSANTLKALLQKSGFEVVELKGKPIPFMRGRGNFLEKSIVRLFAFIEKGLDREFELIALAQKRG